MLLIANASAGGGRVGRDWDAVVGTLRDVFPGLETVRTRGPGDGTVLAAQAVRDGHTDVLSLGGDGTHSEVAAGIAEAAEPGSVGLGILHGGTGGDFSRLLGRGTVREQAERLRDRPAKPIDLVAVTWSEGAESRRRVILNEVSFGMSATICANVNNSRKRLGGRATFLIQTLRTLVSYQPESVVVQIDGTELRPGPISTVILCNGQWAGGGMHFAPRARLADGLLDATVIRNGPTLQSLPLLRQLYNGRIYESRWVDAHRGRRFSVDSLGAPLWIEADGEVLGKTPATVEVLPGAVKLLGAPNEVL